VQTVPPLRTVPWQPHDLPIRMPPSHLPYSSLGSLVGAPLSAAKSFERPPYPSACTERCNQRARRALTSPAAPALQEKLNEPTVEMETWAVMEYCNRGTLQAGVDKVRLHSSSCRLVSALLHALPGSLVCRTSCDMARLVCLAANRQRAHMPSNRLPHFATLFLTLDVAGCSTLKPGPIAPAHPVLVWRNQGYFRIDRGCKPPSPPNLGAVVTTAAQLASGLTYLHDHDIIHGDLCGGNILLTCDDDQPHGFSCKVPCLTASKNLPSWLPPHH